MAFIAFNNESVSNTSSHLNTVEELLGFLLRGLFLFIDLVRSSATSSAHTNQKGWDYSAVEVAGHFHDCTGNQKTATKA